MATNITTTARTGCGRVDGDGCIRYNTRMTHNNNTSKENKMKTQEQLRQEGLKAARNMVRKFKAREKVRKSPSKLARS